MKTGLTLLKSYEQTLLGLKYEELLHFLINDLIKSGFFLNSNYEEFIDLYFSFKLKDGLLNNLENENIQEIKILDAEEKAKYSLK
jgi:hypothetical protein